MSPDEIRALVWLCAMEARVTVKGYITGAGISFTTYLRLEKGILTFRATSIAALLDLMCLTDVPAHERYLELELRDGGIVAMRREDFFALMRDSGVRAGAGEVVCAFKNPDAIGGIGGIEWEERKAA